MGKSKLKVTVVIDTDSVADVEAYLSAMKDSKFILNYNIEESPKKTRESKKKWLE